MTYQQLGCWENVDERVVGHILGGNLITFKKRNEEYEITFLYVRFIFTILSIVILIVLIDVNVYLLTNEIH